MKRILNLLIILPVAFLAAACFQKQEEEIVGKWMTESMKDGVLLEEELTLNEDGSFLWLRFMTDKNGTSEVGRSEGTYDVKVRYRHDSVAVPRIRFTVNSASPEGTMTISYVVDAGALTLIGEERNTLYHRVEEESAE